MVILSYISSFQLLILIILCLTILGDICFIVTHTSKRDANENWWKLGTCSNKHPHLDLSTANSQCCLPPGEYTLECKDSWGDGWGGAYMTIAGKRYCDNFQTGSIETHEILIGKETVPDGKHLNKKYPCQQIKFY